AVGRFHIVRYWHWHRWQNLQLLRWPRLVGTAVVHRTIWMPMDSSDARICIGQLRSSLPRPLRTGDDETEFHGVIASSFQAGLPGTHWHWSPISPGVRACAPPFRDAQTGPRRGGPP